MLRPILLKRRGLAFPGGLRPRFDSNHPASAGISPGHGLCAIAQGNTFINLLNAAKATIITGTPAAAMDGLVGPACYVGSGGSTDTLNFTGNSTATDNNVTLAAIWRQVGTPGIDGLYVTTGVSSGWGMNFSHSSGSNDLTAINLLTAGWDDSGFVITAGHAYFGAVSVSISGTGSAAWVLVDLNTGVASFYGAPDFTIGWASAGSSVGSYAIGGNGAEGAPLAKIAAVMWAPTCLTAPQLLAWAADPWSFWYPTPINGVAFDPAWAVAAAAGAILGAPMQVLMM